VKPKSDLKAINTERHKNIERMKLDKPGFRSHDERKKLKARKQKMFVVVVFVQSVSYRRTMNAIIPTLSETRN
jgi:hypothetical protein